MDTITTQHPIKNGQEKEALDFIISNCFRSGFGTVPKSEIDLILFTAILKYSNQTKLQIKLLLYRVLQRNSNFGILYYWCSDYRKSVNYSAKHCFGAVCRHF